jgi:hypothetical protein
VVARVQPRLTASRHRCSSSAKRRRFSSPPGAGERGPRGQATAGRRAPRTAARGTPRETPWPLPSPLGEVHLDQHPLAALPQRSARTATRAISTASAHRSCRTSFQVTDSKRARFVDAAPQAARDVPALQPAALERQEGEQAIAPVREGPGRCRAADVRRTEQVDDRAAVRLRAAPGKHPDEHEHVHRLPRRGFPDPARRGATAVSLSRHIACRPLNNLLALSGRDDPEEKARTTQMPASPEPCSLRVGAPPRPASHSPAQRGGLRRWAVGAGWTAVAA